MKQKFNTIIVSCVCFYTISIFPQETIKNNQTKFIKEKSVRQASQPKNAKFLDLNLDLKAFGGGLFNYESYLVNTPVIGAMVSASLDVNPTNSINAQILSKSEGRKSFIGAQGTNLTLDQFRQYARGKLGISGNIAEADFTLGYIWLFRPAWPDLYQPNPLAFNGNPDPKFDSYLPTNRNSYQRVSPEINFTLKYFKNLEIFANPGYVRSIETIDPTFDPNIPTHLTPSSYSSFFVTFGAKFEGIKSLTIELSNKTESFSYDTALARDAITGKTHYLTNPNPLYKEINNKSALSINIKFDKINLEIKPIMAIDVNTDPYQGYYSYTGLEPGIEVKQKFGPFRYALKFSTDLQNYGANSFSAANTTDGQVLYKRYTKGNLELKYRLNKSFEIFAEGDMVLKATNYPAYVPGVNPAKKNYDINFSFNNYSVYSGVNYKL